MDDSVKKRPDILTIDIPSSPSHKDMPPVQFMHDRHSQAVDGQCIKCHETREYKVKNAETKGKAFVFKFKRTKDLEGQAYMDLYHDNCIACHVEMKKTAEATGPMEAQCRACHNADFNLGSSWSELIFDRSLHFRHESTKSIPSLIKTEKTNCNACHHNYNEKTKEVFYEKGREEACIYCHKKTGEDDMRPSRSAAHDSCVACHITLKEEKISTGPVDCSGCHDAANQTKINQATINQVKEIPRLQRNQPDTILLTGWNSLGTDMKKNEKIITQHMDAVAFDHKTHEKRTQSCKTCHHESLKPCNTCHTTIGDEKGEYINLAQAMHSIDKSQSCLGCHNEQKKARECAGCHFQMPEKAFKDHQCSSCHTVDAKSQPLERLIDKKSSDEMAKAALTDKAGKYSKVSKEKIPETVVINSIADEYKPSEFPHGLVVQAIFEKAGKNHMAKAFHGNELTLCQGCHHNSPATLTPPKCASCHSETPDIVSGKPGLKGAYHGQCITCHQKMEIKNILPTDCNKCHEKKAS